MDLAIRLLKAVFGFEVHCIEKKYMLINLLRNDNNHLKYSKNEQIESVLLMIVLPTIFMCGDTVEEEKLFTFLKTLDIMNVDDVDLHHHYFGNVKMLLTETFVKQGYLERKLVNKSEEDRRYEYKIGPRALIEISPRKLLQFAVKVDGTLRMEEWTNQYRAVLQAEEEMQQESLEESS
ncbi:non-structural maintenance of chromosomes element 3 homolog isoform X2 [Prorops nasuta]